MAKFKEDKRHNKPRNRFPYNLRWIAESLDIPYWNLYKAQVGFPSATEEDKKNLIKGKKMVIQQIKNEIDG